MTLLTFTCELVLVGSTLQHALASGSDAGDTRCRELAEDRSRVAFVR
jgi:hypothetical protein